MSDSFRHLRVVERVVESDTITSFWLEPVEAETWSDFQAGQFLSFRLPGNEGRDVLRNYSVSSDPTQRGRYRISVKREPAPDRADGSGVGSGHFHHRLAVGDVVPAAGPRGKFVLDEQSERPVLLLSGGVGLTPMVSMLHHLSHTSQRRVHFVHACDSGAVHALADDLKLARDRRLGIHIHTRYRFPTPDDLQRGGHNSIGVIDKALLQGLLPLDDYDVYMCGPTPFMQAVFALLRELGIAKERIAYEFFGPASVLEDGAAASTQSTPSADEPPALLDAQIVSDSDDAGTEIAFQASGTSASWTGKHASLLDFAEAQGLEPDFSCRSGICSSCKTGLISGEVEYFEEPLDPPEDGHVLLCCSRPVGPVVLDI